MNKEKTFSVNLTLTESQLRLLWWTYSVTGDMFHALKNMLLKHYFHSPTITPVITETFKGTTHTAIWSMMDKICQKEGIDPMISKDTVVVDGQQVIFDKAKNEATFGHTTLSKENLQKMLNMLS